MKKFIKAICRPLIIILIVGTVSPTISIAATEFIGTATVNIRYSGSIMRTYEQNVVVTVDHPLQGEANTEQNPFYFEAITSSETITQPGAFTIYSATLHTPYYGPTVVWQYWEYLWSEVDMNYSGTYQPELDNRDNMNGIIAEDATRFLPFCRASIAPESTIDLTFYNNNTMTATIAGEVYDPLINQLCVGRIEWVEISIEAQEVTGN